MDKLPKEIVKRISRKKVIAIIVFPIVIAFLVNTYFISYFENYSRNTFYFVVKRKLSILKQIDTKVDWLILGDSSGNQGVDPSMITDSLGGTSYNLATYADMTLLDDCWMISDLIKRGLTPKNVIIVRVYDGWSRELNFALYGQYPFSWIFGKAVEPNIKIPKDRRKNLIYSHFLPVQHQADRIKELMKSPELFKDELAYLDENGYYPFTWGMNERSVRADFKYHQWYTWNRIPKISNHNLIAIDYLIETAEKYNINVYLVNSPLHDELWKESGFVKYYNTLADSLSNIFDQSTNIHYLNNPPLLFEMKYLESTDHVTDEGAAIFTEYLISTISANNVE